MKKLLTSLCLLALVLVCVFVLPTKAEAATEGDYTYSVSSGEATVTKYNGDGGDVTIPSILGGCLVTNIGVDAFRDCDSLTSVTVPDSTTTIGNGAFYSCDNLTSVTIGDRVTTIVDWAFANCHSLMSVTIPDSVTTIGIDAFSSCDNLTSVTIPDSVTTIGVGAFSCCDNLTGIWVEENNPAFCNDDNGVLFSKDKTMLLQAPDGIAGSYTTPDSVTTIGVGAFRCCDNLTSVAITDSVTTIEDEAFYYCTKLTSVTIPQSVTIIGEMAFYHCTSLTDVYYAGTGSKWAVIYIKSYNDSLKSANIHHQHIHDYTLIEEMCVPPTCTEAGYTEYTCAYGEKYCTDYVPALGHIKGADVWVVEPTCIAGGYTQSTCLRCGKTAKTDSVPNLGHDFSGTIAAVAPTCTEQGYTKTQCVRCITAVISDYTDPLGHSMGLVEEIPATCTKSGYTAGTACTRCDFLGTASQVPALGHSFTNYISNNDATCVANGTETAKCDRCEKTNTRTDPGSAMGHDYEDVVTPPTCLEQGFTIHTCHCGHTYVDCYIRALNHSFTNYVGNNDSTFGKAGTETAKCDRCEETDTRTEYLIFELNNDGKSCFVSSYTENARGALKIPASHNGYPVTAIGEEAFYNCDGLTSVKIPDSVTAIGKKAFWYCSMLTTITIPDSVSFIGDYAFHYCDNLNFNTHDRAKYLGNQENPFLVLFKATSIDIPYCKLHSDTKIIYSFAFQDCNSLINVTIPDGVTFIGGYAFCGCDNLASVMIPDSVNTVGDLAFGSCGLTSIDIPGRITNFGDSVFNNCFRLTNVTIGNGVTAISEGMFSNCDNLVSVNILDGVTTIGRYAFQYCDNLKTITLPDSIITVGERAFDCSPNLTDVYYNGTDIQWDAINFEEGNYWLTGARLHCKITAKITVQPKSITVASGKTAKVTVKATGDGLKYVWYYAKKGSSKYTKSSITASTMSVKMAATWDGANFYCVVTDQYGTSVKSSVVTLTMQNPARITTQPVNVVVASGKTAKVTVKATGDGLKYVWYYAKKGSSKFTKTTVTTASYSVKMSSSVNGRKVYCVVTDKYGNTVKSSTATLYKGTPAKITTQPKGITVASGKTGKLTVKASGSSLKYQWYVKYKGASAFTKVGKSSKTYSFKMASKLNGAQAYCVVKDKYGVTVKSSVVTIKQAPKPAITTQPKSVLQVSGKTVKFSVKASGEGLKYQWYYAKKGSNSFKKLSGAKSATYSVKVSSSVNGRKYYCLVTDKYGQTVKSSAVTLTMKTVAKITTQPKSVTVKNGSTAKVTIKAVGDGVTYTWYYLKPGATKYAKATATGASYSVKMAAAWKNAKVYCVIADKYGNTVKSKVVTVKMK